MREMKFLSPTSIYKFKHDRTQFYREYLADNRPPRWPQTQPMSVGSSFDAFVKSALVEALMGRADGRFEFQTLFEAQVEKANRDWALKAGRHCFDRYKSSGTFAALLQLMMKSPDPPQFEFTAQGVIHDRREGVQVNAGGVPLLGKPDACFTDPAGYHVILDWKVNGYCSKSGVSPRPGFAMCRDGWGPGEARATRGGNRAHKNYMRASKYEGMAVNGVMSMEETDEKWAMQLAIYGWLAGFAPGTIFKSAIDQLACKPGPGVWPLIRFAQHRAFLGEEYQTALLTEIHEIWGVIQSGWIFREMTEEQSRELQEAMDRGTTFESEDDGWFTEHVEKGGNW